MSGRFVVWDLDGTLVDSGADIVASANAARVQLGMPPLADAAVRELIGEGAKQLMDRTVGVDAPEELRRRGLELFYEHYGEHLLDRTRPYAGVDALVRAHAGRQAIATNKPSPFAHRMVEGLGWHRFFRAIVGRDDVPHRKPAPDAVLRALEIARVDLPNAVFVGDSPIDLATARAAGIDFIAVTWGLRPRQELADAPAVVDSVAELEAALARLEGKAR